MTPPSLAQHRYERAVSGNEKMYMAGAMLSPPFAIQAVVEGDGELDISQLRAALAAVGERNPGCRLILKESILDSRWIDSGVNPPVTTLHDLWNDDALSQIPALKREFDVRKGPTCEVILIPGSPFRVLFRAFHGVMDAQGVLFWMEEVFRALQRQPLLGSSCTLTDIDLARSIGAKEFRPNLGLDCGAVTGNNSGASARFEWRRFKVPGRHPGLVAKLAFLLAQRSRELHPNKHIRFMVPVDLRPHLPAGVHGTGNLSNPLFLSPTPGQSWNDIHRDILESLADKREAIVGRYDHLGGKFPATLYRAAFGTAAKVQQLTNRFLASGLLSNIGRVNPEKLSCEGFTATAINFLPFDIPISPFSLVATENTHHVDISLSLPEYLADDGRLDNLISDMRAFLGNLDQNISYAESSKPNKSLTAEERDLIQKFNDTRVATDDSRSLFDVLQHHAQLKPQQIALQCGDQVITYAELLKCVNHAATTLKSHHVVQGDLVGILMDRSEHMVVAILAILWVGAAYVPVDPSYPVERQRYILENAQVKHVVADTHHTLDYNGTVIPTETLLSPTEGEPRWIEPQWNPDSLAYVIYTSGSTGVPKGVEIARHNLMHYIAWAAKVYANNEAVDFPLFSSLAFDLTVTSVFVPLLTGGRIVIYRGIEPLQTLTAIFADDQVDIIKMTPSHLRLLTELPVKTNRLKAFIVGGEDLPTQLCRDIHKKLSGDIHIYNEYGPTEATVGCMIHRFDAATDTDASVPIGVPADNTQLYVLDEHLQPIKPGQVGELYIAGAGLARGYRNQPTLTAQRFLHDSLVNTGKMYKTGDLVTLRPDRVMDYHGRIDEQVKIGGYRIELGEIQHQVKRLLPDADVAVIAVRPQQKPAWLCAFITSDKSADAFDEGALKLRLESVLPAYMMPRKFVILATLPITVNGKVDTHALRNIVKDDSFNLPQVNTHSTRDWLRAAWADVLHQPITHIEDDADFYQLGGDSLKMVQLLKAIRQHRIDPVDHASFSAKLSRLLAAPTLSKMAQLIDEHTPSAT